MITSQDLNESISNFPVTDDISEMENWARMNYEVDEQGNEWYATYTIVDGELVQITDFEDFENAWESYTALFCGTTIENAPRGWLASIIKLIAA